jgi:PmbA protein
MIEMIRQILQNNPEVDAFTIGAELTESLELFFIRREQDMNRAKKVAHYRVIVYKDFEADGVRYRGSAQVEIHPTMSGPEIQRAVAEAVFAAALVRNPWYPLVEPAPLIVEAPPSNFATGDLADWLPALTEALYRNDCHEAGWINSAEVFLNRTKLRLVNSAGVDRSRVAYGAELEVIVNWREAGHEVEIFRDLHFAAFGPDAIAAQVREMLHYGREKALARPTPALRQHTVILTGEPVREFFRYYQAQVGAQNVYEGTSLFKVGQSVQGDAVRGDRISLSLDPTLPFSTASSPFDPDGLPVQPVVIVKDGRLLRYRGDTRYASYLGVPPTGNIANLVIDGGSRPLAGLKEEPYLEIASFSDFQMDPLTGDFGGEIRLGWYHDGHQTVPVSGGSISGSIRAVQEEMYLSRELQQENNFVGPQSVKLLNVSVTGAQ